MFSVRNKLDDLGYNVDVLSEEMRFTFQRAVAGIAKAAQAEWIRLAQSRFRTARTDYINGLRQGESFQQIMVGGEPVWVITLVGTMPNNYEFGMPAFDMKTVRPGWLGGAKAKTAADGHKYIVIPFRHSTTSTSNLAYSGKAAMQDLRSELKKTVRAYGLDRAIKTATGEPVQGVAARVPTRAPVHQYLKGLTKIQEVKTTPDGVRKMVSSRLMTWRVMSENSAPDAWLHPGIQPANLLREVNNYVDRELTNIVNTVMRAA